MKKTKEKSPMTTGRKVKWVIIIVIFISVAVGFVHQYYIHTDKYLQSILNDNLTVFSDTAEYLLKTPTTNTDNFENSDNQYINNKSYIDIRLIKENSNYKDIVKELEKLEDIGVSEIKSDGISVSYQTLSRSAFIYSPKNKISGAKESENGWYYLNGEK